MDIDHLIAQLPFLTVDQIETLKEFIATELLTRGRPADKTFARCARCNGTGRILGEAYCTCALGRDLQRVENRGLPLPEYYGVSREED